MLRMFRHPCVAGAAMRWRRHGDIGQRGSSELSTEEETMNTETGSGTSTSGTSTTGDCAGCDVGGLACSIEMYKRQAVVAEESTTALQGYQEKFDTARSGYTKARADAKTDVEGAAKTLGVIKDSLKCVLGDDERRYLREALDTVTAAIEACAGTSGGCCVGDCSYPSAPTDGETTSSLAGLIDQYRQAAAKNQACFVSLIDLLSSIPTAIADLKAAVAQLAADVKAEGPKDLVRLYARFLVLRIRFEGDKQFGGFSSVNAYVDCVCRAMQCSYAAWQSVIELEGRKARLDCEERARKAECDRKQKDILEDILCEYEKKSKTQPPSAPGHEHDPDCGCGHHHDESGSSAD
jgi:hypothetical protein